MDNAANPNEHVAETVRTSCNVKKKLHYYYYHYYYYYYNLHYRNLTHLFIKI